jgi:Protein of unknown function DUF262/HNH endonuclease
MKTELKKITVRELTKGYQDNEENGVVGYGGKLDIRPPYQREFVYGDKERKAVIETLQKDFPLNVMYWAVREDGNYEVIDGQQRTISICQYVNKAFLVNGLAFHNLTGDKQFDAKKLETEITTLMQDEDVTKKSGIYEYVLTRQGKYLSIRAFTDKQKREAFERQKGVCVKCNVAFKINEIEADHITPWHSGGKTIVDNCQMLCRHDNRIKSGR